MTTDYEKRYNEALERARKALSEIPLESYGARKIIIDAFPELAESEDERIREEIISALKFANDGGEYDKHIAYLEKQKEQKPIIQDVELNDAVYDYVRDHFIAGADFTPEYIKKLMENAFFAGVDYYLLRRESESCEPDTNVEKVIEDVICVYGKTQGEWVGGYDVDTLIVNLRRAFNNKEQKTSWSEEDEKTFWGLTAYIPNEELERLGVTRDDILKKLKSISLQPIQLKEAYKEGFQTARHATALAFMKYLDENRPEGKMCLSNGECEEIEKAFLVGDWEKIERYLHKYHWKPSEEQMEALEYVIRDYREDSCNATANYLQEILDHLKNM